MKRVDREALKRSIELARSHDAGRRNQIDAKLETESWEEVAMFASYVCQHRSLNLRPWQLPPCEVDVGDEDEPAMGPKGGKRSAALLLQRMLAAGLSKFEPDPIGALARVEAEKAARA
jgi:hypothetical protein